MAKRELKRWAVLLAVFVVALAAMQRVKETQPPSGSLPVKELPSEMDGWKMSDDREFEQNIINILGTRDLISRSYVDPAGRMVSIIIVSAVNNRSAFHPPEYCMTGGGSEIIERRTEKISAGASGESQAFDVNEMVFSNSKNGRLLVWNWYAAENKMTASFYRQQARLFLDQVKKGSSRGAMVNLYIDVKNENFDGARETGRDFTKALLTVLTRYI